MTKPTFSSAAPVFVSSEIYRQTGYNRQHPLAIERIGPVMDICTEMGWLNAEHYHESPMATFDTLTQFHDKSYVEAVMEASLTGKATPQMRETYALGTMENPVFKGLFERAATSVGGSILAAQLAMAGRVAYHPAGGTHHGRRNRASGFCYFNDPVFAIREFQDAGLKRVAYLDLDAHHGDGVEDAFSNEPRILCISIHESNRWPGTGLGHGQYSLNYPVPAGFGDLDFSQMMTDEVLPALKKFAPDALVITCGADALAGDPLSKLSLSNSGLWDAVLGSVALSPRAVVLGGGGYNPWTTARCWSGLWARLNSYEIPTRLPERVTTLLKTFHCDLVEDDELDPQWLRTIADREPAYEIT